MQHSLPIMLHLDFERAQFFNLIFSFKITLQNNLLVEMLKFIFFQGQDDFIDGRAQNPSATLSGENVAWEETISS